MSKENYELTSREEISTEEIPVATIPEGAENTIIPENYETDDDLIVYFRKPFTFEGEKFTQIDLNGLEDLRGRDLTAIEKAFNKTGISSFMPETTTTYAKIVATKATGLPAEFFEELPISEVEKIKNVVTGFLYKDE